MKDEQALSVRALKLKLRAVMVFSPWRAAVHLISQRQGNRKPKGFFIVC